VRIRQSPNPVSNIARPRKADSSIDDGRTPVDLALRRGPDGRLRPTAAPVGIELGSTSTDQALATVTFGPGQSVSYGLTGANPVAGQPNGASVRYAGALPDTDVVLTATRDAVSPDRDRSSRRRRI
jgi:hypothetical protein